MFMPCLRKVLPCFFILLCLLATVATPGHALHPVRSASEIDYPPFCIVDTQGEADGFAVELLRATLAEMALEVTFEVGPWSEVKQSLIDSRVDVLPLVGRTPEREEMFDFTFPYLVQHGTIVVREDEKTIHSINDLHDRKVAVMGGDNAEEFMRRSHPEVELITTKSFVDALEGLAQGDYDAVVMQKLLFVQLVDAYALENLKTVGRPLKEFKQEFCFAVKKGNRELLNLLNEGLGLVFNKRIFDRLYHEWILPLQHQTHTKSRIVVGGDSNYPPYEYLDENGQPAGYNVELTRAIARKIGAEVDIQLKPWYAVREGLFAGRIDMTHGMFYSAERERVFDFSSAHTRVSHVIASRLGAPQLSTLEELNGKTVVVMQGDIVHDLLIEKGSAERIVLVDSQEEALELVAEGDYDYALTSRVPALYWIKKNRWDNLVISSQSLVNPEYCYAALHDNRELLEEFEEGLAAIIASGEYREIYQQTLGKYDSSDTKAMEYLLYGLIVLGLGLVVMLAVVGQLRMKIRQHARILTEESQQKIALLEQVAEREARINLILNSTAEGVFGVDLTGECTFFNLAAEKMLGYNEEEMLGKDTHQLLAHTRPDGTLIPSSACQIQSVFDSGIAYHVDEGVLWKKDGDWLDVSFHVHPMRKDDQVEGAVVTFADITEKKKLLEQRIRSGQLSALGELATGVAHEINNPITGVINYAQMLLNKKTAEDPEARILEKIIKEGNRIASIVRNLLSFAHKDRDTMQPLSVGVFVHEAVELLQQHIRKDNILLDIELDEDLPQIYGNAQKLEQVLLNLISNARYALNQKFPEGDPNKILRVTSETVDGEQGERVRLTVWDQGQGISKEDLERVFNRFFTTKKAGDGTGLGLSIVHDILEEHDAIIKIDSMEGQYTRIDMEFPVNRKTGEAGS